MNQIERLHRMKIEIYRIAHRHNAEKVYVFGSCSRKEETQESDIDLMVQFLPQASFFDQIQMEHDLADLLQAKVDVVDMDALRDGYFKEQVSREMVAL